MKKHLKKVSVITVLLTVLLSLHLAPGASAQVSVQGNNLSAVQIIEQIQKATDYIFFYNSEDMSGISVSSINLTGPIEKVLEKVFSGTDVVWRIQGKEIVLKKSAAASTQPKADVRAVSGIVVDESDKSPLIGATIRVQGSDNIAISDIDGRFSISGVSNRTVLEVSYVGYKQRDFRIGDLGYLEISLSSENELEGVVVVGAGVQKKVSVTGSIAAIKGDELKSPSSSLTSNLAGKLSGVIAVTSSGEPGSTSQFYIRGISTFGGRSTPLILLDGVEISAGDLDNLPAESIDNFSILKDASATAIYGARGANGVMLITTKSGTENTKAHINASFEQSFLQPVNVVEYADGPTYMRTYNEALLSRNQSASPRYSETQIKNTESGVNPYVYPNVDWYGLMFKKFAMSPEWSSVDYTNDEWACTHFAQYRPIPDAIIVLDMMREVTVARIGFQTPTEGDWPWGQIQDLKKCEVYISKTFNFQPVNPVEGKFTGGGTVANYDNCNEGNDWKLLVDATLSGDYGTCWFDAVGSASESDRTGRYLKIRPTAAFAGRDIWLRIREILVDYIPANE